MCVTAAVAPRWLAGWLAGNLCIYMYVSVCQQQQQQQEEIFWKISCGRRPHLCPLVS